MDSELNGFQYLTSSGDGDVWGFMEILKQLQPIV